MRIITKFNQWQNTAEVIDWFKKLPNKNNRTIIKFDIEDLQAYISTLL